MPDATLTTTVPAVLKREIGTAGDHGGSAGPGFWGNLYMTFEETSELQWPNDVLVYDQMRRTDAQIQAIIRAAGGPIRAANWRLGGSGVRPEVLRWCQRALGLIPTDKGRKAGEGRPGIPWDYTLRHGLLTPWLGYMPLEKVYRVGGPGEEFPEFGNRELAHLDQLAPRLPRTITGIETDDNGDLVALRQHKRVKGSGTVGYEDVRLERRTLVMLVNEMEGRDWTGTSWLRPSYKHWLIKDGLLRLGPLAVERNGMGLAVVRYPSKGSRSLALAIARSARAGMDAGVALPPGYFLELVGVQGQTRDELELVKYHDQAMSRSALAMLLDLGHDRGARSLGETFVDFFLLGLNGLAGWLAEEITEQVVRELVLLNFGAGETYPVLTCDRITAEAPATSSSLKELVDAGILVPDADLEVHERRRRHLPIPPGLPTEPPSEGEDRIEDVPSGTDPMPLPEPPELPGPAADLPPATDPPVASGYTADELQKLVNAAAILIRSGFQPDAALEAMGLDPIKHLGLLPVTVQKPQTPVSGLARATRPTARQGHDALRQANLELLERRVASVHARLAARRSAAARANPPADAGEE